MLRLYVASDLHFEFRRDEPLPPLPHKADFDVLVLAGDIGELPDAISGIDRLLAVYPGTPVVYVAGNHEFFRGCYQQTLAALREAFREHDQVHFLEMNGLELCGYTILGCTLWSGLNGLGPEVEAQMLENGDSMIPDFALIGYEDSSHPEGVRPFHPRDMQSLHWQSVRWLEARLAASDARRTIVVTHFPPTMIHRHEGIPVGNPNAYFQADCEDLLRQYQPALWLYGHNHYSREDWCGDTRLISNQLGYPGENVVFSSSKIIFLP